MSQPLHQPTLRPPTAKIEATYQQRTPHSAELFARAERLLPGGNSRQAAFWTPYPLTLERAEGIHVWDADGNRYIDVLNNYTALVHGHAYPAIVAAVQQQIPRGTAWAANNPAQLELAACLVERVASVDEVRFTNSGTEAANLALTLARTLTGRHDVLMARYGYHGSLEEFESGTFDHPGPHTHVARYGDTEAFDETLKAEGSRIAAVFLEPVLGAAGIRAAEAGFLERVQTSAHKAGALFVLDEVITFRLATGGRQQQLGIEPDLTMFGKSIGGGFPVGAVGGRRELMEALNPKTLRVHHSGTYNANPITMTAGAIAIRELTAERIAVMEELGEQLKEGLEATAERAGVPLYAQQVGSLLNLYLSAEAPPTSSQRDDGSAIGLLHLAALNHGVFIAPRGMMALSTVMTRETIIELIDRLGAALDDVAAELR